MRRPDWAVVTGDEVNKANTYDDGWLLDRCLEYEAKYGMSTPAFLAAHYERDGAGINGVSGFDASCWSSFASELLGRNFDA